MTLIILCLIAWVGFKAFGDAIVFAKGGEDCHEIWHIVDWIGRWMVAGYAIYKLGLYRNFWLMVLLIAGSFMFNFMYHIFRALNVYKLDNKFRIKWLEKILGRGGII